MDDIQEKAIEFIMGFYNISREQCIKLYWDEVESYMRLTERMAEEVLLQINNTKTS